MVEKTLSSGTLSLRFMQNARRAQHLPAAAHDQAHVQDDAQWEVSPEIRNAWHKSAYRDEKTVSYETSYLPFLFPSLHDTPAADPPSSLSPRPRGRRVFDKRGEEITHQASSPATDITPTDRQAAEQAKKARPHSISAAALPSSTLRPPKKSIKDPSKDAKNAIFDMTGVGTDLRQSSSIQGTFLRPAGVDAPADSAKTSNPPKTAAAGPKIKRSRASADTDKPKKKTRLELIE